MLSRLYSWFASLRLTVVLLCASAFLVFLGTMAQVHEGLYNAQARYFRSLFVYWSPGGSGLAIPVFPGGYLLGTLLLLNLLAAQARHFKPSRKTLGLLLVHVGIILLLLGQLSTDLFQVESHMRLAEGDSRNYSENSRDVELAIIDPNDPQIDKIVALPASWLARPEVIRHPEVPFTLRVKQYLPNSRLAERKAGDPTPPPATQGVGTNLVLNSFPPTTKLNERNLPSAVVEVVTAQGALGTWLLSAMLDQQQTVAVDGKPYQVALRFARYYKPFSLELLDFSHDKYQGTEIPKNFSSRVRLRHPDTGEDRETLIYMNNPLRYGGETFYQSGYDENDPSVTILQVVRNPGWLTPYISCTLVSIGLLVQFLSHLLGFIRERRTA